MGTRSAKCPENKGIKTFLYNFFGADQSAKCPENKGIKTFSQDEIAKLVGSQQNALKTKGLRQAKLPTVRSEQSQQNALKTKGLRHCINIAAVYLCQQNALKTKGLRRLELRDLLTLDSQQNALKTKGLRLVLISRIVQASRVSKMP